MTDKARLIAAICSALDALSSDPKLKNAGRPEWTKAVINALCEACTASGISSTAKGHGGEWLYDVVGTTNDGTDLKRIHLAAECEWGNRLQVIDDFHKLQVCRADVKVMVFDDYQMGDGFEELKRLISVCEHTQADDAYLLAASENEKFGFRRIDAYVPLKETAIS